LRVLLVGVEGDFHLDHAVDGVGRAAGLRKSRGQVRQQSVGVEIAALAARADEALRFLARHSRHHRPRARNIDRHRFRRPVVDRCVRRPVELPLKRDALAAPQCLDQL
jgi:hypothetical protein